MFSSLLHWISLWELQGLRLGHFLWLTNSSVATEFPTLSRRPVGQEPRREPTHLGSDPEETTDDCLFLRTPSTRLTGDMGDQQCLSPL